MEEAFLDDVTVAARLGAEISEWAVPRSDRQLFVSLVGHMPLNGAMINRGR